MDDISYRLLEKFTDGKAMNVHDTWIYFLHSQVVPGVSNVLFDAAFRNSVNFSLISVDEPLTKETGLETFRITDPGRLAYKNEKKARKKSLKERYWWAIAILAFTAGCFGDIGKEWMTRKIGQTQQIHNQPPSSIVPYLSDP